MSDAGSVILHPLHTACIDCVFAQFNHDGDIPVQTGCEAGRLEKFRACGDVVDAENSNAQFAIINGRRCNMYRPVLETDAETQLESLLEQVRRDERIRLAGIILLQDGDMADWQNRLYVSVMSLVGPLNAAMGCESYDEIVIVNNQSDVSVAQVQQHLYEILRTYAVIYQFVQVIGRDESGGRVNQYIALHEGTRAIQRSHFLTIVPLGHYVSATLPFVMDRAINEDLKKFVILTPADDWTGLTVSVKVYRSYMVGGFEPMEFSGVDGEKVVVSSLADKLRRLVPELVEPLHDYVSDCGCGPRQFGKEVGQ